MNSPLPRLVGTALSRRDMLKFLAATPLVVTPLAAGIELPSDTVFTPSTQMPDVSLQNIGLPADTRIPVANNREYWELYPTAETIALAEIEQLNSGVGLRFIFTTDNFELGSIDFQFEGPVEVTAEDHALVVVFPKTVSLTYQRAEVHFRGVTKSGERSPEYFFNLQYNSNAQDAAAGRTMFSRIGFRESNLKLAYSHVGEWIVDNPTDADRAYARREWGQFVKDHPSAFPRARAIMRDLIRTFEPHRGTPSDAMDGLHPFRQLERLTGGLDHCWCANMVEICSLAFNALDIPCRLVRMRHTYHDANPQLPGKEFEFMLCGGHTIAEVYDDATQQWYYMDPSQRIVGIKDRAGEYLNFFELHLQVNQPHRNAGLTLEAVDPTNGKVIPETWIESPRRPNLSHFARREQRFYYFRRGV
ncbi:MAG: hypothetical protein SynsKO_07940 [Synoicihabitans sp.]